MMATYKLEILHCAVKILVNTVSFLVETKTSDSLSEFFQFMSQSTRCNPTNVSLKSQLCQMEMEWEMEMDDPIGRLRSISSSVLTDSRDCRTLSKLNQKVNILESTDNRELSSLTGWHHGDACSIMLIQVEWLSLSILIMAQVNRF